jgi:regulator of replication initiation timing
MIKNNKKIHKPKLNIDKPNREELFRRLLGTVDFTHCENSLQVCGAMFNAVFPTIERVCEDNEGMIAENSKLLKELADLDEKYKKLVLKYEDLKQRLTDAGIEFQEESEEQAEGNE